MDPKWCWASFGLLACAAASAQVKPAGMQANQVANIVARVDDKAILLQDVIAPARRRLEQMRQELPSDEYRKAERVILKKEADTLIDRYIILKEVEIKLKDEGHIKEIRKKIAEVFEKNLLKFARESGLKDKDAVRKQLEAEGTSLEIQRKQFVDNMLANEYLREQMKGQVVDPSREELLAYYREHIQQFQQNASVVWRHIEVKIAPNPKAAAEKIHSAQQRLTAGEDFAKVAKELSEDPAAAVGGLWPATSKGSYFEPVVDKALFTVPVGRFSTILRGQEAFHIVKIQSRTSDGAKPFEEVQKEITRTLREKQYESLRKKRLAEYRTKHYVESIFDRDEEVAAKPRGQTKPR